VLKRTMVRRWLMIQSVEQTASSQTLLGIAFSYLDSPQIAVPLLVCIDECCMMQTK
jgi:hypothetical protein